MKKTFVKRKHKNGQQIDGIKSSASQPYREMQIKITICYFTLARKVYYKKCIIKNIKC